MIPVYSPYLPPNSLRYAHQALDSTWLSSQGEFIGKAQEKLKELLQIKHVLLVNNGTSATHLVAKCLKRKFPEIKKILVPNNVYIAAINSFLFDQDFELISVDADLETWNYNLESLDQAISDISDPFAILVVHNIGNIINVPILQEKYPQAVFVEDNCEGFLGKYQGKFSGTESLVSSISFFGNKNITCGEGGALLTNDTDMFEFASCVHGQGQSKVRFIHQELGYNYRMTNVQAAILLGQLEVLPEVQERKQQLFEKYRKYASSFGYLTQEISAGTIPANWMFGVRLPGSFYALAQEFFNKNDIEIRPMFYPLSRHSHLSKLNIKLDAEASAKLLSKECFILPSSPNISPEEHNHIISILEKYAKGFV